MIKIVHATRDEIHGFDSYAGNRYVSLDFNAVGPDYDEPQGIEIVMPRDSTPYEIHAAEAWCIGVQEFYKCFSGIYRPIRGKSGVKTGLGVKGVIHTEPFFANDYDCIDLIQRHTEAYVFNLMMTLGKIGDVTFIYPHKSRDPGAVNKKGFSERDFAKYTIMPVMSRMYGMPEPRPPEVFLTEA